jgi:hypothetical membrane protein
MGMLGLASTAAVVGGSVVAAIPYAGWAGETYSPLNHFISELGEVGRSELAAVFNVCIVLGGLGFGLFVTLLSRRMIGLYRSSLAAAGLVTGLFGTLVGVFPMNYSPVHGFVAGMFFCTSWIAVAIFSVWLLTVPRPGLRRWLLAPGALGVATILSFVVVFATYHPLPPGAHIIERPAVWTVPSLEWAALLTLMLWLSCVSVELVRNGAE